MYTVLIAEDELLVRIGISSSIPWEQMGMRIIAETADGASAWQAFLRYHPDIVIADIRMPQMDGIELLRRIRAEDSECAVIIVTNVEHDGTLAEARQIGIVDYLIKAVMKPDDILSSVLRARDSLPAGRQSNVIPMDNGALWQEFLSTPQITCDDFEIRCAQMGTAFFKPQGFVLLGILPSAHLSHRLRSSLVDMFAHRLEIMTSFLVLPSKEGAVALAREPIQMKTILGALENLACYVQNNFDERLVFVVQPESIELDALRNQIAHAARYLSQPFFFDRAVLILENSGRLSFPELDEAAHMLRRCAPLTEQMAMFMSCADDAEQIPETLAVDCSKGERLGLAILNRLNETANYSGINGLVDALAGAAKRKYRQSRLSAREELLTAIDYIEEHLSDELSIRQISEVAGYHPAYFSSLFKQEMGMSYSKFLTTLRIQKAKELLRRKRLSMQNIAELCGFCDLSYFSHKFKQEVGMTPSEWRLSK